MLPSIEDMRFLEVKLYDNTANGLNGLSVVIQLHDQAGGKEQHITISRYPTKGQHRHKDDKVPQDNYASNSSRRLSASQSGGRLLPTDRLVLNALRARISEGEQATKPVRLQELMDECGISRSQARICLKRLTEKGLVNRVNGEARVDNQEGYSYKLSKDVL